MMTLHDAAGAAGAGGERAEPVVAAPVAGRPGLFAIVFAETELLTGLLLPGDSLLLTAELAAAPVPPVTGSSPVMTAAPPDTPARSRKSSGQDRHTTGRPRIIPFTRACSGGQPKGVRCLP